MELNDALEQFEKQEHLHTNEGRRGVENLCRIVHAMGYRDGQHFGQFSSQGSYGDLINFLEDNSGCVEAIKEWIVQQEIQEWADELESRLDTPCENCGAELTYTYDQSGTEVWGCPNCTGIEEE
jgi:hypothetical protein